MAEPRRVDADLLIVGAGPAGLFGAYYAGFRGWSVAVVDSLPELGGQVSALYPEKAILDVAGFPNVKGRVLVEQLVEQAGSANPTYLLDRTAIGLTIDDDPVTGGVTMELDDGSVVTAKVLIITAGIGKFTPRPLPAGEGWENRGLVFFVPSFAEYAGRDVVIVGGGDSAFDWAHSLHPIAESVTVVHRRDRFRAHQATVDAVLASDVEVITNAQVTQLLGDGIVEKVEITLKDGEVLVRPAQSVVAALGFVADLGAMEDWGLELDKRHIPVDTAMRTNLPRVFAAGDITEYDGKVRLIAVGFGEVATAVNNAALIIDPEAHVFPGTRAKGPEVAGGRAAVRLSEQEVEDFLQANIKVQVATIGPAGAPHLTTLFYVVDDGKLAFWTYGRSQKILNLRRDPRISCLVEDGVDYFELRGVSITGTARLVEDYDEVKRIGAAVATVMANGADLGAYGDEIVSQQAHKRVAVVVEPDHVASWDHRKMS